MAYNNTKNYMAHGGGELVIGGKLTFLPGAVIDGAEALLPAQSAPVPIAHISASEATTIAALREDFNALLTALESAGYMAADKPQDN